MQGGFNFCPSDCNYYSSRWSENPALKNRSTFPPPMSNIKWLTTASTANVFLAVKKKWKEKYLRISYQISCNFLSHVPFERKIEDKCRNNLSEHQRVMRFFFLRSFTFTFTQVLVSNREIWLAIRGVIMGYESNWPGRTAGRQTFEGKTLLSAGWSSVWY